LAIITLYSNRDGKVGAANLTQHASYAERCIGDRRLAASIRRFDDTLRTELDANPAGLAPVFVDDDARPLLRFFGRYSQIVLDHRLLPSRQMTLPTFFPNNGGLSCIIGKNTSKLENTDVTPYIVLLFIAGVKSGD
jgi:hypothetical protein